MFKAALFTTGKSWKQPGCPWMDEQDVVHSHKGYDSALKRKEILTSATTGMNCEDITLSERARQKGPTLYDITYMTYRRIVGAGAGGGKGEVTAQWRQSVSWEGEQVLEMDSGDGRTAGMHLMPQTWTLKTV